MNMELFNLTVNGRQLTVRTDPERSLLDVLREDLKLTGTKYGCGEGRCGSCTVLINGRRNHACVVPMKEAADASILTIEGLAQGDKLHPVQEAFLAEGALQCGYCTGGMIMSTVALLREKPKPSEADVLQWMEGHVCRCCGYVKILNAVRRAAAASAR
jgi:aerobic-type carbon monoxide dehydrogenase small subunit (CoxS/CutS family)